MEQHSCWPSCWQSTGRHWVHVAGQLNLTYDQSFNQLRMWLCTAHELGYSCLQGISDLLNVSPQRGEVSRVVSHHYTTKVK